MDTKHLLHASRSGLDSLDSSGIENPSSDPNYTRIQGSWSIPVPINVSIENPKITDQLVVPFDDTCDDSLCDI